MAQRVVHKLGQKLFATHVEENKTGTLVLLWFQNIHSSTTRVIVQQFGVITLCCQVLKHTFNLLYKHLLCRSTVDYF